MNDQELEDKVWENAKVWTSKTCLCKKVGGDKKRCFDKINLMTPLQLKEKEYKNKKMYVRIDMTDRAEFENILEYYIFMLKSLRQKLQDARDNQPNQQNFWYDNEISHYIPAVTKENIKEFRIAYKKNMKNPKGFKLDEKIKIWYTHKPKVKKILESMKICYSGLFQIISRSILQKTLGVITTREANIRIKKCQSEIENHFKLLQVQNSNKHEFEAIRSYHLYGQKLTGSVYDLGRFRI